jgi:hypothetical protein
VKASASFRKKKQKRLSLYRRVTAGIGRQEGEAPSFCDTDVRIAYAGEGMRAITLISKSKPASQLTPTPVKLG